ncbi:MAG: DUF177 domain-containing protein [Bacteroidales bacterium]|nr:DUF177 domain-containing protein [Bacteroidales bacterium]
MQPFVINLEDSASSGRKQSWKADGQFFGKFGNTDILDADLEVVATFSDHGATVDVAVSVSGTVTVPCDRCLGDLVIPVDTSFEETYTPQGPGLDISQEVYDYVCTGLPLQRIHEEGTCDAETTKYLSK